MFSRIFLILTLQTAFIAPAACGRTTEPPLSPRTTSLLSEQPIEDPTGKAMLGFYSALTRSLNGCERPGCRGVSRILHYGDSHAASGLFTGPLRSKLQRDFGDAGPGFILAGRPWYWYRPFEADLRASSGWRADGLSQNERGADGRYGLSGVSFTASQSGQTIKLTANCGQFDIYLLKQPDGGRIDIYLDGVIHTIRLSLSSARIEPAYLHIASRSNALHTIELRTVTAGAVRVLGIAAERGASGVEYDVLGINGARAYRPLQWDWSVMTSNLRRNSPDLIVFAYGSNEVADPDLDLSEYQKQFARLLNLFHRAAPTASLLVIAPPERDVMEHGIWRPHENMPGLVEAQRQAALSQGAAFWNLYQAMGGRGSIERWATEPMPLAQRDRVHLTALGYSLAADSLYREIIRGYLNALWKAIKSDIWTGTNAVAPPLRPLASLRFCVTSLTSE